MPHLVHVLLKSRKYVWLSLLILLLSLAACSSNSGGNGINSTSGIEDRFNSATIPPFQAVSVTAKCPANEQMVSGGWGVTTPAYRGKIVSGQPGPNDIEKYFVAASYPSSPNAWTVTFTNEAVGDARGDVLGTTHVECLTNKSTQPQIISRDASDPFGSTVTATCPQGTALTGGGYQLTNLTAASLLAEIVDFKISLPVTTTSWEVGIDFALNQLQFTQTGFRAYAVCSNALSTSLGTKATITAPSASDNSITEGTGAATCANGQVPVGAGYDKIKDEGGTLPLTLFSPNYGSTPAQWSVIAFALPPIGIDSPVSNPGGSAAVVPICAQVS